MSTLWPDSDAYKTVSGEGKGWLTVGRVAVRVVTLNRVRTHGLSGGKHK